MYICYQDMVMEMGLQNVSKVEVNNANIGDSGGENKLVSGA